MMRRGRCRRDPPARPARPVGGDDPPRAQALWQASRRRPTAPRPSCAWTRASADAFRGRLIQLALLIATLVIRCDVARLGGAQRGAPVPRRARDSRRGPRDAAQHSAATLPASRPRTGAGPGAGAHRHRRSGDSGIGRQIAQLAVDYYREDAPFESRPATIRWRHHRAPTCRERRRGGEPSTPKPLKQPGPSKFSAARKSSMRRPERR